MVEYHPRHPQAHLHGEPELRPVDAVAASVLFTPDLAMLLLPSPLLLLAAVLLASCTELP